MDLMQKEQKRDNPNRERHPQVPADEIVKPIYKHSIITIIKKHLPLCTIYLFGSRARNTHSPTSDIDIALDNGNKIPLTVIGRISEDLEESLIPFFVDLADLNSVHQALKTQIKKEKILWSN
jgi:uncharacterized protein